MDAEIAALANERQVSMAGQRIGPYRLVRLLGQGGMGQVYLAGRVDDFNQQVTIKLIKPGMDSERILRRFRNERRILASLNHAHIARLLDGGTTDKGQPYFVMEYVDGEPIDAYCDRERLSVKKRLELFCKVCSAVQYAQDLVVHRDIKPSNILVTAEGEPKLLDFGVAKLLNPELSGQTVGPTGIDQMRPMTPEYASPEQASGRQVTKAADVYSLGVLLFKLLTGRLPYRFRSRLPQEIERVICETEPAKPSTAVQRDDVTASGETLTPEEVSRLRSAKPDGLRRRLSGDLDNIVLMAMRKDPRRRYESAGELAEDIQRHLAGFPVVARPSTFAYRTAKYVRRHKLQVGFTTVLAFLTILLSTQTYRLSVRAHDLDQQRQRTEKILAVFQDVFKIADPREIVGSTTADRARRVLEKSVAGIEQLSDQPADQATLMETLALVYLSLGIYDRAGPLLENDHEGAGEMLREVLELRKALWGPQSIRVFSEQLVMPSSRASSEAGAPLPPFEEGGIEGGFPRRERSGRRTRREQLSSELCAVKLSQ